jgi:hypothetical protein
MMNHRHSLLGRLLQILGLFAFQVFLSFDGRKCRLLSNGSLFIVFSAAMASGNPGKSFLGAFIPTDG